MRFVSHTHTHGDSLVSSPPVSSTHISRIIFSVGVASLIGSLAAPTAASSGHASGVTLEAAVAEGPDTPPPPFAGPRLGCPVPGEFRSSRYQWNRRVLRELDDTVGPRPPGRSPAAHVGPGVISPQPTMRVSAGSKSTTSASGRTLDRAWSLNGLSRQHVSWRIPDWGNMAAYGARGRGRSSDRGDRHRAVTAGSWRSGSR